MSRDFYDGEASVEEQITNQENASKKINKNIIYVILIVIILTLLVVFFVTNFNKTIVYEEKNNNSLLKSLTVSNAQMEPKFNKEVHKYNVFTEVDYVEFDCELDDEKAKLSNCEFADLNGKTKLLHKIRVVAENGSVSYYNMNIIKKVEELVKVDSVTGIPTKWVDQDVIITVKASSKNGLHSSPYSFDEGKTWGSKNTLRVSSNGTIKILVRDKDANLSKVKEVYVGKIDKVIFTVELLGINYTNTASLVASVEPSKAASGYSYQWYKNNVLLKEQKSYSITVKDPGKYHVIVKNGVGKTVKSNVYEYLGP